MDKPQQNKGFTDNPLYRIFGAKPKEEEAEEDGLSKAERIAEDTFLRQREMNIRRRRRHIVLTVVFAFAVSLIFMVACVALFFNIENIEVEGSSAYDREFILLSSGLVISENLYSIDKAAIERAIIKNCPYIKSVKVDRRIPTTVALVIEEETAAYYFEFFGEYFALSADLRVLERTLDIADLMVRYPEIIRINTQEINYAVAGERLVFQKDTYFSYAREMLSTLLGSDIGGKITLVDFTDKFNIYVNYEDRFKIELGDINNIDLKVRIASKILDNFEKNDIGVINVETNEAFAILKGQKIELNVNKD